MSQDFGKTAAAITIISITAAAWSITAVEIATVTWRVGGLPRVRKSPYREATRFFTISIVSDQAQILQPGKSCFDRGYGALWPETSHVIRIVIFEVCTATEEPGKFRPYFSGMASVLLSQEATCDFQDV
jgi:hypothetical protein